MGVVKQIERAYDMMQFTENENICEGWAAREIDYFSCKYRNHTVELYAKDSDDTTYVLVDVKTPNYSFSGTANSLDEIFRLIDLATL